MGLLHAAGLLGIPVLKGAGDNVLPTRGMVDLECKVGQTKVVMRKVVICALDINVLSSYSAKESKAEQRKGKQSRAEEGSSVS